MFDPYDDGSENDKVPAVISTTPYTPYQPGAIPWVDEDEQACFPLSGPVHEYMHWITQTTHTPTLFHLGSYLTQLCQRFASLGFRVEVGGRTKRPRLYALLVAPSGVGKSTPIHRANSFFQAHVKRTGLEIVPQSYAITAESTPNGITKLLQESVTIYGENEVGLLVCEEAERFFARQRKHPIDALLCSLYDGNVTQHVTAKNLQDAKKGDDKLNTLFAPIVSLLFAMPEASFLGDGMDKASDTGLIPRFMVFEGRIRPPKPHEVAFPEGEAIAGSSLDGLIEWWQQKQAGVQVGVPLWPSDPCDGLVRVKLSQSAADVYASRVTAKDAEFYQQIENMTPAERNFRAYRLRTYDQAYVIAALYAISRKSLLISASDMQRALNLADMSINAMREMIKTLGKDAYGLAKESILHSLKTHNAVWLTANYLLRRFAHKYPEARVDVFEQALSDLVKTEVVSRRDPIVPAKKRPGRPPVSHFALAERAPQEGADPPSEP